MQSIDPSSAHRLCIAPMMERTDRHFRYFMRLISRHVRLYTEMITTNAILRGDPEHLLKYDVAEHPLAVQLGGSDPQQIGECATICKEYGYDEINLNVGCPSDRVQSGAFGACLMNHPDLVAECVSAMMKSTDIPVTVKCRTGVDKKDSYTDLVRFIDTVKQAGCMVFIIHARKAWLKGLSPKENRSIPPLNYASVYQLKRDFPELTIIINGGFTDIDQVKQQLKYVDGVMIGRAAYADPYILATADELFNKHMGVSRSRLDILRELLPYAQHEVGQGTRIYHITRHLLGLFQHQPGARKFRRWISENAGKQTSDISVLIQAIEMMEEIGNQETDS